MMKKPMMVAVNKSDWEFVHFSDKFNDVANSTNLDCVAISAKEGFGLENLIISLRALI